MAESKAMKQGHQPSILLNASENDQLFELIGQGCMTTATAVVELYLSQQPDHRQWNKVCTGVTTLIKDNYHRSYFIRVYDVKNKTMVWEQELFNEFYYKAPRQFFHTFEADNVVAGLNFSSADEANRFKQAITSKLEHRRKRLADSKNKKGNVQIAVSNNRNDINTIAKQPDLGNSQTVDAKKEKKDKKQEKPRRLSRLDIGTPQDFRVVAHIKYDSEKKLQVNNVDPDIVELFEILGVKAELPGNKRTVDFIYNFVDKNGGMGELKRQISKRPQRPTQPPQLHVPRNMNHLPETTVRRRAPLPPPPPPPARFASLPSEPSRPTHTPSPASPPPPPPPPVPQVTVTTNYTPRLPIHPSSQSPPGGAPDMRADLMYAIRSFQCEGDENGSGTGRRNSTANLKKVETRQGLKDIPDSEDGGMVGALARALAEIKNVVTYSDDDDDASCGNYDSSDGWSD